MKTIKQTLLILFILFSTVSVSAAVPLNDSIENIPVHDTIYQKVYLDNVDDANFWDSKFWTSFLPFLIAGIGVISVLLQRRINRVTEGEKLLLNKMFVAHEGLLVLIKQIGNVKFVNDTDVYHKYFESKKELSTLVNTIYEYRENQAAYLTKDVKLNIFKFQLLCYNLTKYAKSDVQLKNLDIEYFDEINNVIRTLQKSVGLFFKKKNYKHTFKLLHPKDYRKVKMELNQLQIIKKTTINFESATPVKPPDVRPVG